MIRLISTYIFSQTYLFESNLWFLGTNLLFGEQKTAHRILALWYELSIFQTLKKLNYTKLKLQQKNKLQRLLWNVPLGTQTWFSFGIEHVEKKPSSSARRRFWWAWAWGATPFRRHLRRNGKWQQKHHVNVPTCSQLHKMSCFGSTKICFV